MKKLQKLTRAEMRNVMGGLPCNNCGGGGGGGGGDCQADSCSGNTCGENFNCLHQDCVTADGYKSIYLTCVAA